MASNFIKRRMTLFSQIQRDSLLTSRGQTAVFDVRYEGKDHKVNNGRDLKFGKDALFMKVKYFDTQISQVKIADPDEIEEQGHGETQSKLMMLNELIMGDCEIDVVNFEDKDAQLAFRHSSAHILGYAIEQVYDGSQLTIGPAIKDGFFYDFLPSDGQVVKGEEDYNAIEKAVKSIVGQDYPFERLLVTKEQALDLFSYNKFKTELILKKVKDDDITSVFRIGDFIDLCTGPHIPSTKYVKAFKVTKHSQAYWLGDAKRDSLQRVYGISFPQKTMLSDYLKIKEEAQRRDHRVIGPGQDLFFFSEFAPGSPFFLPHGTKVYNKLIDFMQNQYKKRGYQEVITPNLCDIDLWKVSGHYKNYKENLYLLKNEDGDRVETQGLKPMNCPCHCLVFKNSIHSYKELPIRLADFGVLHRNELSGALSGLTRVRRFQQDDAHIFCRRDQIEEEVQGCLEFLEQVYGLFGFKFELFLSTRPEDSLGSDELWEEAETQLKAALDHAGRPWKLSKGDGAFYGPKIDIVIHDALDRPLQCGTIQLDFQLPIRFNLQYNTAAETQAQSQDLRREYFEPDEYSSEAFEWQEKPLKSKAERPVMIHRAIFGSMERFMAILIEHLGGKWPLWLSPRQVRLCPLSAKHESYCRELERELRDKGWEVDVDSSETSLNKKVRNAQLKQYNYIVVVGDEEVESRTIDVRQRDGHRMGKLTLSDFQDIMVSQYPDSFPLPCRLYKTKDEL